MKCPRRSFLHLAAGATMLAALPPMARAQPYPARPVRLIVGFPAGGTGDILARLIGQWLSERLGQPFIIENRPGAAGSVATETVVKSPFDGHTLLVTTAGDLINATLYAKLNFVFLRDIEPVASLIRTPNVMEVNPSFPAKSVAEFIAYAKANPNKINMASSGIGSSLHVAGELFKLMAGIKMVHVPYRGDASAVTDLLGSQVQVMFGSLPTSVEHIRAGKLRALAVTTATRSNALPDIPTVSEYVSDYESSGLFGVGAPKNTPAEIIERLNKEINAGLADPKLKAQIAAFGGILTPGSAADFRKLIAHETEKWGKVIRAANIKPE
jgi:tripartite-type tricarboxylate transporter receptor subunit TctC